MNKFCISFLLILCTSISIVQSQQSPPPIVTEFNGFNHKPMIFHITGDGGINGFDVKMAKEYKSYGLSYVMLNSLSYFWTRKTPEQLAKDVSSAIADSMKKWKKEEFILVGFSFGAEIAPFMYNQLPEELKKRVQMVVLITPSKTSDFTIHVKDMMSLDGKYAFDVVKEIEKIKTTRVFSIFGSKETSIFPNPNKQSNLKIEFVKGGHHFTDGNTVMERIAREAGLFK